MTYLYTVTAWHRPDDLRSILDNLARQRFRDFLPIIVANGAAKDCGERGILERMPGVIMLESEPHQSFAKNAALERLRKTDPDSVWTTFDGDDWYG
ncbi:MAG TPA: hypothetical protein VIY48_21480, partial [Candidatus Paceibacterota bacterium]